MIKWDDSVLVRAVAMAALAWLLAAPAIAADQQYQQYQPIGSNGLILPAHGGYFGAQEPMAETVRKSGNVKPSTHDPVTMEADAMGYDKDHSIAIARGHVTVLQGDYVLKADQITYYQAQNIVVADGHVSVLQPSGDVFFADKAQLRDDMSTGVIKQFQARMKDNSVFAAAEARKVDAATTILKRGTYTPCKLCDDLQPFWQVRARKMKLDERAETITYHDAQMEIEGVPVFYTPYMSQPTPDSAARSGFLTPEYFSSNNLGRGIRTPYYWRIDEDKDMTLTPWLLSNDASLLQGDYRELTDHGNYEIKFSGTNPKARDSNGNQISGNEFRGNLDAKGEENIDDDFRIGFDINRASDDTYLRRYGFGSERVLFSRIYAEAADQRNNIVAQALAIQGLLSTDNSKTTPMVLPSIDGYYETQPDENGLRYHVSGDIQSLTRQLGADENRISTTVGASLPYVTDGGQVLTSTINLRQDAYNVRDVPVSGQPDFSGNKLRTIPQAAEQWQYPLIKSMESGDAVTIEPIVLAVAQPTGENPVQIPNEDNTLIELSDLNLFSIDRMPGLDSVDSGSRVAYGFRSRYLFSGGESLDGLLGQNYSFSGNTPFPNSTAPGKNISDYIGRLGFDAKPVNISYRFALSQDSLSANRSEIGLGFDKPWLHTLATYRAISNNAYLPDSKEATMYVGLPVADEWDIYGSGRRDLVLNQMIAAAAGIVYHNDCFSLTLQGLRTYTRDRDIAPDTQVTLRIGLKNLGEIGD